MKFLNLPIAAAVIVLGFSPLQALAGETQASTSSQFGGEGQSTSQNNSGATMENNRAWSGDQNAWGRGGPANLMPIVDNTPVTNGNTNNTGPNKLAPVTNYVDPNNIKGTFMDRAPNCYYPSGGGGTGGGSSGSMNTYSWSKSKSSAYKPFSSTPPDGWGTPKAGKHKTK